MRKNHSTSPLFNPFDRRSYSPSEEAPTSKTLSTAALTDLQSQFSKSKNPTFSQERASKSYRLYRDVMHAIYTATGRNKQKSKGTESSRERVESIKQSLEEAKTTGANLIQKAQQTLQTAEELDKKTQKLCESAEHFQNTASQPSFLATLWLSFLGWLAATVDKVSSYFKCKKNAEQAAPPASAAI